MTAWVLGADGIGPLLDRPLAGESGRWLLLDGYVYAIHEDHPTWREPGRWAVNEARPPDPGADRPPR